MKAASLTTNRWWAYLQLMRPANIVTAWADILVGFAASGSAIIFPQIINQETTIASLLPLGWLLLATTGLYGGGVVFNDVFDAELDAKERPERPIPSDRASLTGAIILGSLLLVMGIVAAVQVSLISAGLAAFIALAALFYDAVAKHHVFFGPLNMGLCRGANLLLGVSVVNTMLTERWYLAFIPIVYIAAITAISQGEVTGGKKITGYVALGLIFWVISSILLLGLLPNYQSLVALPFAAFLAGRIIPPFFQAAREPIPEKIRTAVMAGVLSLIVLDAAVAAGFTNSLYGLAVLILLPISLGLAKLFSVT